MNFGPAAMRAHAGAYAAGRRFSARCISPHRLHTLSVQFACRSLVQAILAAVLADCGGGVADDDDSVAALQGDGNRAARRVAYFTDHTPHVGSSS